MSTWSNTGMSEVHVGERHVLWAPVRNRSAQGKRALVCCPQFGVSANVYLGIDNNSQFVPAYMEVPRRFASLGYPVVAADMGPNYTGWGNDTSRARVLEAWQFVQARLGAASDKMLLWGISMGATTALSYASQNESLVAALAAEIPAVDLRDIYNNNRNGHAADIATGYGSAANFLAQASTHSPAEVEYSEINGHLWYGVTDPICIAARTEALAARVPGIEVSQLPGAHVGNQVNPDDVVAFLTAAA